MLIANLIFALPSLAGVIPAEDDVGTPNDRKPQKLHSGNKHENEKELTNKDDASEEPDKESAKEGETENDDGSGDSKDKSESSSESMKSNSTLIGEPGSKNATAPIQGEVANDVSSSKSSDSTLSTSSSTGMVLPPPSTVNSDPSQLSNTPPAASSPAPLTTSKSSSGTSGIPIIAPSSIGASNMLNNPSLSSPSQGMESSQIGNQFSSASPQKSGSDGMEESQGAPPQSSGQLPPKGPGPQSPQMSMGTPPGPNGPSSQMAPMDGPPMPSLKGATGQMPPMGSPSMPSVNGLPPTKGGLPQGQQFGYLTTAADLRKIKKAGNCQTFKTPTGFTIKCVTIGGQKQPRHPQGMPPTGMPQRNIPPPASTKKHQQMSAPEQQSMGQGAESSPSHGPSQPLGSTLGAPVQSRNAAPKTPISNPTGKSADDQLFASISQGLSTPAVPHKQQ